MVGSAQQAELSGRSWPGRWDVRIAGRYEIDELPLGRGGMGAVHSGHDTHLDRRVAVKFLHVPGGSELYGAGRSCNCGSGRLCGAGTDRHRSTDTRERAVEDSSRAFTGEYDGNRSTQLASLLAGARR